MHLKMDKTELSPISHNCQQRYELYLQNIFQVLVSSQQWRMAHPTWSTKLIPFPQPYVHSDRILFNAELLLHPYRCPSGIVRNAFDLRFGNWRVFMDLIERVQCPTNKQELRPLQMTPFNAPLTQIWTLVRMQLKHFGDVRPLSEPLSDPLKIAGSSIGPITTHDRLCLSCDRD
jgi:hypothetical protein